MVVEQPGKLHNFSLLARKSFYILHHLYILPFPQKQNADRSIFFHELKFWKRRESKVWQPQGVHG